MSLAETIKKRITASHAEKEALRAENAQLRAALELDAPMDEQQWGEYATQTVRDQLAASALIHERLRYEFALKRLGFRFKKDENGHVTREEKATAARIFGTPGCQALVAKMAEGEVLANAENYVRQLNRAAMSDDDSVAIRAIEALAKLGGLNKEKPVTAVDARSVNLFLLGQKGATAAAQAGPVELNAADFLTHEPGEPERIFEVAEGEA